MQRYFPQGVATDEAFCNREQERAAIKNSMQDHEHIVIVAPRRYGKTSLITQVLRENSFPSINIDFFFALSQAEVVRSITEGASKIISTLLPKTKSSAMKLINAVITLNPKLTFNFLGQKCEISTKQATERSISEILLALDQFAEKSKKCCVVVFDEFQQIGELKENHAIEAAIRHAVERSQYVSYVFCGSKRHLLHEMFSDKTRPLYHLCDLMTIDRIKSQDYHRFLNKMAKNQWKKNLDPDAISEIIYLTENHPYYVNALCRRLWRSDDVPSVGEVRKSWDEYVSQQAAWISTDLSHFTLNRKKVITALAYHPTQEPQGQTFCGQAGLNPSGIKKCLEDLCRLDIIYRDSEGYYRLLDPAVAYFVRKQSAI